MLEEKIHRVARDSESRPTSIVGRIFRKFGESSVDGAFFRGAGWSLVVKVGAAAAGLVSQVLLARLMGLDNFGQYIYVISWVMTLLILCLVGFDSASVRFVARYHGESDLAKLRGYFRRSIQIVLVASLITATGLAITIWILSSLMPSSLVHTFFWGSILLPLIALLSLGVFQLRGLRRIVQGELHLSIARPLLVAMSAFVLLIVIGGRPSAAWVMVADISVTLLLLIMATYFLVRALPKKIGDTKPEFDTAKWLGAGGALLLVSSVARIHSRIDVLMIGSIVGTTEAGIYKAATDLAALVSFGLAAVNMIVGPVVSELYSQKRFVELQRAVLLAALSGAAFGLIALPTLLLGGNLVLGYFGEQFTAGYPAMVVICVGQLVKVLAGPVGWILIMTGHHRKSAIINGVSAMSNVLLNIVLIPWLGIFGAAIATAITVTLQNVWMLITVRRSTRLHSSPLAFVSIVR